jgi:hypothetical protein
LHSIAYIQSYSLLITGQLGGFSAGGWFSGVRAALPFFRGHMTKQELRRKIDKLFSEEGVKDLCFDLDIDFDNLPGETKKDIVRELVVYCEQHGRLEELASVCAMKWPNETWIINELTESRVEEMALRDEGRRSPLAQYRTPILAVVAVAIISLMFGIIIGPRLASDETDLEEQADEMAAAVAMRMTQTRQWLEVTRTA